MPARLVNPLIRRACPQRPSAGPSHGKGRGRAFDVFQMNGIALSAPVALLDLDDDESQPHG
jgi:hypothetical protein